MFVLALPLLIGCNGGTVDSAANPERLDLLSDLAQHVAVAGFQSVSDRAVLLAEAATVFCDAPTEKTLDSVRSAWWNAREPWKQTEIIQFGPTVEYPLRLGPKMDDWPVNAEAVEELIEGDKDLDVEGFGAMGSATRGYPVLEYLLWASGEDSLTILSDDGRRCEAVSGSAGDIAANAASLLEAWQTDWAARVSEPGAHEEDAYENAQDVLDEWVNRMAFTVENIRALKLGKPVGDDTGGEPQADMLESRFSARSLMDARDALAGVQAVWDGGFEGSVGAGIESLVADDSALVEDIDALLSTSATRLAEVPEPLEQTISLEPELVVRAQEALLALQVAIQVDLAQALGVTITFNDNDGD